MLEALERSVAISTIPIQGVVGKGPRTKKAIRVQGAIYIAVGSRRDAIVLLDTGAEVNTVDQ